ncbi:MAG: cobalamin synthesis protein P47K [Acidobacteriota bacterium]|jgi:G3E family GTPase|nr:cobalamin synthesis protein P47K [Acidobacteriota bacterium]
MKAVRIVFVGGFLGAGKTTLLWAAAERLAKRGLRVGLVTNDQASELVDTAWLSQKGLKVAEVSGSCFCCNFDGLLAALRKVGGEADADVIVAEPVGSCTDLSATIMQPLKQDWGRELSVAPLSVLADPGRLASILDGGRAGLHADAAYIFRKQLEEADIILLAKADKLSQGEAQSLLGRTRAAFPLARVSPVSAATGAGVDAWLDQALGGHSPAGAHIAEVDYDLYAHGEAVLGWLNGTVELKGGDGDWNAFSRRLLEALARRLDEAGYAVGHVKTLLEREGGDGLQVAGNLTGKGDTLSLRGDAGSGGTAKLTVNARVETSPEKLDALVREALQECRAGGFDGEVKAWRCLQPGRPNPTHRFTQVVAAP